VNLADLCPDGREWWAEYISSVLADDNRVRILADQAYREHVRDCELCTPMEELGDES